MAGLGGPPYSPDGKHVWDGYRWVAVPEAAVPAHPSNTVAKWFKALGCLVMLAIVVAVGLAGSGIVLRGDPAAFLPAGFIANQQLRGWAKDLGLIPSASVGSAAITAGPRPIIFLPGIMGSYLSDASGNEVWPQLQGLASCVGSSDFPILGGLLGPVLGDLYAKSDCDQQALQEAAFSAAGSPLSQYSVDVANGAEHPVDPSGPVPSDTVSPLAGVLSSQSPVTGHVFWYSKSSGTMHFYDITAENAALAGYTIVHSDDSPGLSACAGIQKCFVPVGLDWRQSAQFNAQRVLTIIDQVLTVTGSDRVDILAHSQGGLVAEALLHTAASVGKVYRVVTLGTPFLGAPKVMGILLDGECALPQQSFGCPVAPGVLQQLAQDYPGVAELEPSRAYFSAYGSVGSPLYSDSAPLDSDQMISALDFSNPGIINAAEGWHDAVDAWAPLDPSVGLLRMVGYDAGGSDSDTPCSQAPCDPQQSTVDATGTITAVNTASNATLGYGDGDGTVPLFSANLNDPVTGFDDQGGAHDMYWCAYSHMGLAQSTAVWLKAESYLNGAPSTADSIGGACPGGGEGSLAGLGLVS